MQVIRFIEKSQSKTYEIGLGIIKVYMYIDIMQMYNFTSHMLH